jgi:hypothetical protein
LVSFIKSNVILIPSSDSVKVIDLPIVHIFQFVLTILRKRRLTNWRLLMKDEVKETSDGLNQLFEIINAKGDLGELKNIVDGKEVKTGPSKDQQANEDLT